MLGLPFRDEQWPDMAILLLGTRMTALEKRRRSPERQP